MVAFRLGDLVIRFVLPFPKRDDKKFTHKKDGRTGLLKKCSDNEVAKRYEQEVRSRWRALLLVVKAKLEAVECGISTIEREFLAFIVMPNDVTLGDWLMADVLPQISAGTMPKLLAAPKPDADIIDVEEVPRG